MKPEAISRYDASGGKSQLRTYADGEGVIIELQAGVLVVACSTVLTANNFMEKVLEVVGSEPPIEAQLSPSKNGRRMIPFTEAQQLVAQEPGRFKFIAVDTDEDRNGFTWTADDPGREKMYPDTRGEATMALAAYNRRRIRQFIEAAATTHVREDINGILKSARRLTRDTVLES